MWWIINVFCNVSYGTTRNWTDTVKPCLFQKKNVSKGFFLIDRFFLIVFFFLCFFTLFLGDGDVKKCLHWRTKNINFKKILILTTRFLLLHGNIDKKTHFCNGKHSLKTFKHYLGTFRLFRTIYLCLLT